MTIVPQNEMGMLDLESVLERRNQTRWSIAAALKVSSVLSRNSARTGQRGASPGTVLRQAAGAAVGGLIVRAGVGALRADLQVPPDKSVLEVIRRGRQRSRILSGRRLRNS